MEFFVKAPRKRLRSESKFLSRARESTKLTLNRTKQHFPFTFHSPSLRLHAKVVGSVSFFIVNRIFVRSRRATVLCAAREENPLKRQSRCLDLGLKKIM